MVGVSSLLMLFGLRGSNRSKRRLQLLSFYRMYTNLEADRLKMENTNRSGLFLIFHST